MIHEHSSKPIELGQAIDRNHLVNALGRMLYPRFWLFADIATSVLL